jgi:hypothetical protein
MEIKGGNFRDTRDDDQTFKRIERAAFAVETS